MEDHKTLEYYGVDEGMNISTLYSASIEVSVKSSAQSHSQEHL